MMSGANGLSCCDLVSPVERVDMAGSVIPVLIHVCACLHVVKGSLIK